MLTPHCVKGRVCEQARVLLGYIPELIYLIRPREHVSVCNQYLVSVDLTNIQSLLIFHKKRTSSLNPELSVLIHGPSDRIDYLKKKKRFFLKQVRHLYFPLYELNLKIRAQALGQNNVNIKNSFIIVQDLILGICYKITMK